MSRRPAEDEILRDVPQVDGYPVLEPCVLYDKIGQGGFGAVYRAVQVRLDLDVGVKCMLADGNTGHAGFVERFHREAKLAARISHTNLVRVFDIYQRYGLHYLVMELVEGESGIDRLKRADQLPAREAATIVLGAARGLAAAHQAGIVHRDIKPDNLLIANSGEVKVADLGLACLRQSDSAVSAATMSMQIIGTPRYMPPEQWENLASVGAPGDVWSLGMTLYTLLAGKDSLKTKGHSGYMRRACVEGIPDVRESVPDVPDALARVVRKCTQIDTRSRYADAGQLVSGLETVLEQLGGPARLDSVEQATLRDRGRPPASVLERVEERVSRIELQGAPAPTLQVPRPPDADSRQLEVTPPTRSRCSLAALGLFLGLPVISLGILLWWSRGGDSPEPAMAAAAKTDDSRSEVAATSDAIDSERSEPEGSDPDEGVTEDSERVQLAPEGFTALGDNVQGYAEYRHERTGLVFVRIPGGTLRRGGGAAASEPVGEVELDDFLIAKTEVTQQQWRALMPDQSLAIEFAHQRRDEFPALNLSWTQCRKYCDRAELDLPSEAQWEFACRAGSDTRFSCGDTITSERAKIRPTDDGGQVRPALHDGTLSPSVVDAFPANSFGLHGLHGNAAEWCQDIYDSSFYARPESLRRNPLCTSAGRRSSPLGMPRSLRGGSFVHGAERAASAWRTGAPANVALFFAGFRPVKTLAATARD